MKSVENEECGKCGVWKMRSVENVECGNCRMWKIRSVENAEDLMISTTITSTPFPLKSDASLGFHDVVWWLTKFFGKIVAATITFFHIFGQGHEVIRIRRQSRVPRSCCCRWSWWSRQEPMKGCRLETSLWCVSLKC